MGWFKTLGDVTKGAIIGAAGSLGGAALESRGQGRAIDAQTASADKALAFQREQGERGDAAYAERMQIWKANREALLKYLGIDITPPMVGGGAPMGVAQGAPQAPPPGAVPRGMTPGMAQAKGLTGRSLGELASMGKGRGSWNDWGSMGLRGGGNA